MKTLDGRAMAAEIRVGLRAASEGLREEGIVPHLAVLAVGDDPAASSYTRGIERAAAATLVDCEIHRLPATADLVSVLQQIDRLNEDPRVHGILIQTPLPVDIDATTVGTRIKAEKDVDGFNPISAGHLLLGRAAFAPATAAAVMETLRLAEVRLEGGRVVVIGRSAIVGKPVALLLLRENATVTICHSKSRDLAAIAREADILIVAVGRARMVDASYVKPGAIVIDVGINSEGKGIVGDVDAQSVERVAGALTPVPGGVGPLTSSMVIRHTIMSAQGPVV